MFELLASSGIDRGDELLGRCADIVLAVGLARATSVFWVDSVVLDLADDAIVAV